MSKYNIIGNRTSKIYLRLFTRSGIVAGTRNESDDLPFESVAEAFKVASDNVAGPGVIGGVSR